MSTIPYGPNGEYRIGTRQKEPAGKNEYGQENDISTINLLIPTYGAWAGPEWAADKRAPAHSSINWSVDPCMNEDIKDAGADPEECYSLIDAMAKHHDWEYIQVPRGHPLKGTCQEKKISTLQ